MKTDWEKIQDYQNEHKGLLIVVADPVSDSISVSFGGYNAFVRFPMETMDKGVIFNALVESKFEQAIHPFLTGLVEATGMNGKNKASANLLKVIGGAIRSFGIERGKEKRKLLAKKLK